MINYGNFVMEIAGCFKKAF